MGGEYTPEQEDAMLQEAIRRGLDFETARDMIMSGKGRDLIPVRHLPSHDPPSFYCIAPLWYLFSYFDRHITCLSTTEG